MRNTMLGRVAAILVTLIVSSAASPALAFGAAGHEAVCEIAYKELTPEAKQMMDTIMSAETDNQFKSFHAACVWPIPERTRRTRAAASTSSTCRATGATYRWTTVWCRYLPLYGHPC